MLRNSSSAPPDEPGTGGQKDVDQGGTAGRVRVLLIGGPVMPVGPVDAAQDRQVEVVGSAETIDQAESLVELHRPDAVVVIGNGVSGRLPVDLVRAVLRLACADPSKELES